MERVICITGVAGFIGSKIATKLVSSGFEVIGVDNLSRGKRENVPHEVEFYKANCEDFRLQDAVKGRKIEAILHLAGQSSADVSFDDPIYDINSNTVSTINMMQQAAHCQIKQFIFASSMAVYGNASHEQAHEDGECRPSSCYGISKLAAEKYGFLLAKELGIDFSAFRMFNVYGPGQNLDYMKQGMLSIYLAQLIQTRSIEVKGSLRRVRDFVYIDDVVHAWTEAIGCSAFFGRAVNLGTGIGTSISDAIALLAQSSGRDVSIREAAPTRGDVFHSVASTSCFVDVFGWVPSITPEQGISAFTKWALDLRRP